MKKTQRHLHQAQVGITAVLLTTVLLAIGVSLSSRMVSQVTQETSRSESTQTFNEAESVAGIGGTGTSQQSGFLSNTVGYKPTPGEHMIYLYPGETIEVETKESPVRINFDSGCESKTGLMVSYITGTGRNTKINYDYVKCAGCTGGTYKGYTQAGSNGGCSEDTLASYYNIPANSRVRIKVLFKASYLSGNGIVTKIRAAAANQGGNEVRVVEQNQTTPTSPGVFDFGIFVANGSIMSYD